MIGRQGSRRQILVFGLVALIVLVMAMINYVNLSTAQVSHRRKEIGIRQVAGAGRKSVIGGLLVESITLSMLSSVLGLLAATVALPYFANIANRELTIAGSHLPAVLLIALALGLLIGILAGLYPAIAITRGHPIDSIGSKSSKRPAGHLRKVLVVTQFASTLVLLILMAFIFRQVKFMTGKDLGFEPDQVMLISINEDSTVQRLNALKSQFRAIRGVSDVTCSSAFPGAPIPDWNIIVEGISEAVPTFVLFADGDYADALDIEVVAGRFVQESHLGVDENRFVVNEEFVRTYSIADPIGHQIRWSDQPEGRIVGVVRDFHFQGLGREIEPLLISSEWKNRGWMRKVGMKITASHVQAAVREIEALWSQLEPGYPMRYTFLDQDFANLYDDHRRFGRSIWYGSLITILIAVLGLFGLTAYTVERRAKEISIRKVLGATVSQLLRMLGADFLRIIVISALIAFPVGYWLVDMWLEDFAYRTSLNWWVFAGAGLGILALGLVVVIIQAIGTVYRNPIQSIRAD